jgi:hypothetical protein
MPRFVVFFALASTVACRAPAPTESTADDQPSVEEPSPAPDEPAEVDRVSDPFGPWDGVWKGNFQVKHADEILTELEVEQRYRSDGPDVQYGRFRERNVETGEIVTATATNSVTPDGLRCEVTKSTGEAVVHQGRLLGDGRIEWFRKTPDLEEHFFERVFTDERGRTWYTIEGWGRYGDGPKLDLVGRYRRVGDEPVSFER